MKRNSFIFMLAAAALVVGVMSCTKENGIKVADGKPTTMELTISFKKPAATRATVDANANVAETEVKTVTVFIFDATSNLLVDKESLTAADFTYSGTGGDFYEYTATSHIPTTTGAKIIYVGVNLPTLLDISLGQPVATVKSTAVAASITDLVDPTTTATTGLGFSMFSAADVTATFVEVGNANWGTANTVNVQVDRFAAKVAIQASSSISYIPASNDGLLSNVEFAIMQSYKKLYRFKYVDGTTVKSPNWLHTAYNMSDYEDLTAVTNHAYVAMNASGIVNNQLAARYAMENTGENIRLEKEATYASIKANFAPNMFLDGDGLSKGTNGLPPTTTFWIVSTNDGVKNFFNVSSEADDYMLLPVIVGKAPVKSDPYTNGVCYYNLFLNPDGGYDVIRNNFYKATVSGFLSVGNPLPGIKDPERPLDTDTEILVNFEILPWTMVEWTTVLKP